MLDFLKVFVRGIVCTLLLPFILAFLAIYAVYLLVVYLIMLLRNIIIFFGGGSVYTMKEEVQAKKILEAKENATNNMADMLAGLMQTAMAQNAQNNQQATQPQIQNAQPTAIDVKPIEEDKE